ncbi:MAG: hypothetical protein COA53_05210 [Rhodobacteraceae bacterium]|nr:MAG: hypothetical protein COA53_05210 [Paracoccaceae bacterium]
MFADPLFYIIILACVAVLGVLLLGVGSFAKSGEFHKRNANKIMRWRVGLQFVAVVLIMLYIYLRDGGV